MSLNAAWKSYDDFFDDQYLDPAPAPKPSEETTQDTLDLREEIVDNGSVYEVSTTKTGLVLYTGRYPVVPTTPDPEKQELPKMLILPSSMNPGNGGLWGLNKKGSGQTVKMNPMTAVAIRSKTADKR